MNFMLHTGRLSQPAGELRDLGGTRAERAKGGARLTEITDVTDYALVTSGDLAKLLHLEAEENLPVGPRPASVEPGCIQRPSF